ncbi:hypothetical protein BC937DRAFT_87187 [Endogone sp. FLAS-F59071]|nr:hypothetical protein BC937DRAFT_87185 [Endogone sp. FLAS-F59071]RUS19627.1 hypothetical protein BC937DRAFT_87187 [Endogone sp. FLAS-F59071]|eukprot:RUS19625.1 hypothetical protein BC937DRAFT_87185 [Endogone sp. FLAS-F59071]
MHQFLDNDGLRLVLNLLRDDADGEVRNKAQYAVSGTIKHFPAALAAFTEMGGYDVLNEVIARMEDLPVMRKIIFMYNTLVMDDANTARILIEKGIIKKLEEVLEKFKDDEDMVENVVRTLHTLLTHTSTPVPANLVTTLRDLKTKHGELQLAEEEWKELRV